MNAIAAERHRDGTDYELMPPDGFSPVDWRLERLEQDLREMRSAAEGWHNTLGAQNTSLQTQIAALQQNMPDKYVPRREVEEKLALVFQSRREEMDNLRADYKRLEESQQWMMRTMIATLAMTIVGLLQAIFRFIPVAGG